MFKTLAAGVAALCFAFLATVHFAASAAAPCDGFADPLFCAKWQTTDLAVQQGKASYSWFYGPQPGASKTETYAEAPGGQRLVQYFDKARMELTKRPTNPSAVTTGLLTVELVSGQRQEGDAVFVPGTAAQVPVAGDGDDANGPVYASFGNVATLPSARYTVPSNNDAVTGSIDRTGKVGPYVGTLPANPKNAYYIQETGHNIPDVFINWLNGRGNWVDIMGFPITEAYWATVKVGGVQKTVLIQLFERRVLTFTPSNSPQYQVEYGNIGLHYFAWRYGTTPAKPINANGVWRGTTSQGKTFFFTVDNNAVTTIAYDYVQPGCDIGSHDSILQPPPALTGAGFSFDESTQFKDAAGNVLGLVNHTTTGTFTSDSAATGTVVTTFEQGTGCTGTLSLTWTATKDPPADTSLDGAWVGKTSQGKDIVFTVVNHTFRLLDIGVTPKYDQCQLTDVPFAFLDLLYPQVIKPDNTFRIADVYTDDATFIFTGAFTSKTAVSGNFQFTVNVTPPPGQVAVCNGQINLSFTAANVSNLPSGAAFRTFEMRRSDFGPNSVASLLKRVNHD